MKTGYFKWAGVSVLAALFAGSCGGSTNTPVSGSESHFLETCDEDCPSGLECLCGVCTKRCDDTATCSRLAAGARCVELADVGANGCPGASPAQPVCDRPCARNAECSELGDGFACSANGVCRSDGAGGGSFGGAPNGGSNSGVAGTAPGTSGSGGASAGASGAGSTSTSACDLPVESGSCSAVFPRFAFENGQCRRFAYGGCGGNANNFTTFEECATACGVLPAAALECERAYDCVRKFTGPCAPCGPANRTDYVAINRDYQHLATWEAPCSGCSLPPLENEGANFGARCNAGRCELFDVRDSDYSECTEEVGCELRRGTACCEDCAGMEGLTAIRQGAALDLWSDTGCLELPILCGTCDPFPAAEASAECVDSRCRVVVP